MTRAQADEVLGIGRAEIAQWVAKLTPIAGEHAVVEGGTVSLTKPRAVAVPADPRPWRVVIWVRIVLTQAFEEQIPEDALPLVSGPFVFPPIPLDDITITGPFTGELEVSEYVLPVTASVTSEPPQVGLVTTQLYAGGDLTVPYGPGGSSEALIKGLNISASVTFYVRGHYTDATQTFETGFSPGNYRLTVESQAMDDNVSETTVVATYAGTTASFTAIDALSYTALAITRVTKI